MSSHTSGGGTGGGPGEGERGGGGLKGGSGGDDGDGGGGEGDVGGGGQNAQLNWQFVKYGFVSHLDSQSSSVANSRWQTCGVLSSHTSGGGTGEGEAQAPLRSQRNRQSLRLGLG